MAQQDSKPNQHFDIFLSHNWVDKPWVKEIYNNLTPSANVFFDEESIVPGDNIVAAVEKGIENSSHVVLILTPESVQSQWVALEVSTSIFTDPNAAQRKIIPILLKDCKIPLLLRRIKYVDARDKTADETAKIILKATSSGVGEIPTERIVTESQFHLLGQALIRKSLLTFTATIIISFTALATYLGLKTPDWISRQIDSFIKSRAGIQELALRNVPIGTIIAFAGDTIPPSYLLCDGRVIDDSDTHSIYRGLHDVIGDNWGSAGDGNPNTFNLPDLQGYFLRGATESPARDPDYDTRTDLSGDKTRKGVGSYQGQDLRQHGHPIHLGTGEDGYSGIDTKYVSGQDSKMSYDDLVMNGLLMTNEPGCSQRETRPKNAAVNWIIKY
jgi:hypothetical protein